MPNKVIIRIFRYLLYLSLLAPLLVSKELLFPFVTTKALFLRVIVELALPFYIYLLLANKQYRPNLKNPLTISIIAFWVINLVSAFFGVNAVKSLWGNFERMGGVYFLLHLTLLYFYLLLLARISPWLFQNFLKATVWVAGLTAFYGILVAMGMPAVVPDPSLPRISIVFGNPIYVGSFLILPMFLSLFFVFQSEKKWEKLVYSLLAFIQLVAIYLSGTRGAVVALAVGLFLAGIVYVALVKNKKIRYIGAGVILIFFAVVGLLYASHEKFPQGSTLRRVFNLNDSNTQSRIIQWGVAIRGFKDYPILGTGPENYYIIANKYHNPEIAKYDRSWFDKPHNYLLEVLLTTGAVGFLAYASILIFTLWGIVKAYKTGWLGLMDFLALFAGLVIYQLQNLFVFDSIGSSMMLFIFIAFCNLLWEQKQGRPTRKEPGKSALPKSFLYAVFVICLLVVAYALYSTNVLAARVAKNTNYGFAYVNADPGKAKGYFDQALSLPFNFDLGETVMRFDDFAIGLVNSTQIQKDPSFAKDNINQALQVTEGLVARVNNYPIYWYKLANIYMAKAILEYTGFDPAGEAALQKAIDLAPNRIEARTLRAQLRWMQGNYPQALADLEEVLKLNPDYKDAQWQMAVVKRDMGQKEAAIKLAEELYSSNYQYRSLSDVQWVIDYYRKEKNYDKAIAIYSRLIEQKNLQLDGFTNLAKLYAEAGQKDKALELADKIGTVDPARKQGILDFIQKLK